jgi:ABC-type transporter Mla subunit MlaD
VRRTAYAALAVALAVAAAVLTGASGENPDGKSYRIVFDDAFGLVESGDVKIGGVRAGRIDGFGLTAGDAPKVEVTVVVTEPGFASLRRDSRCSVRQQSLIGEYFVDCDIGSKESPELPDGARVPVERTSSTIPPDLINAVMRRPYRERFRLIVSELGAGLAGRPGELNEVIRRAHPGLRETTETFKILARQNRVISDFIAKADTVSRAVQPKREQVARWAREAEDTASIQASRSEQLGRYWNRLPVFLGELEPTMAQLERTADRQIPLLRRLRTAAPSLERFLTELEPFSEASRGSIRALGEASVTGREALSESSEEIVQLRKLSTNAPSLAKPLRQFLQTIDDRGRSTEDDPLAAKTSPPAPDKAAYSKGQGFTGMEGLLNYIYYQTLAVNGFDQISHVLRIALLNSVTCGPYEADPSKDEQKQCSAWLGPYQPGVIQPDPTDEAPAATAKRVREAEKRRARGEAPKPGDPEAPPLPGRPDLSKPQIVLPAPVQELLDALPAVPPVPPRDGETPDKLLDFLLGP